MTEATLHGLSQDLRLLARADVKLARDGRLLSGSVNPSLEKLRLSIQQGLEDLQDGKPVHQYQQLVTTGRSVVDTHRELLRSLRRQMETEMRLSVW